MRNVLVVEQPNPIMDMNITPLIDVMLVLLIMFIITIPIQTHAVRIDLPVPCPHCLEVHHDVNTVMISPTDQIAWNGIPISQADLSALLRNSQQMQSLPELHLRPDAEARYEVVQGARQECLMRPPLDPDPG